MPPRTASCSCGQLRIEVEGEPRVVGLCHCLACQQRTGSVFAALASFSAPFKVFGTATEYARVGDQGARSSSGSARCVGLPSSTPKTDTMSRWASPWVRLPIHTFRRRKSPSMIPAGIRGFSCRPARDRSTRTPLDRPPRP